jgi:hypothetical protein
MRTITFKGQINDGLQEKINLATLNGKTGYKIVKFKIISPSPGTNTCELLAKVFVKDQSGKITNTIDFTDGELLATAYFAIAASTFTTGDSIIFDSEITNQDMYITVSDNSGNSIATNYFLELETMPLSDIQSTQMTLKNLRSISSR